MRMKIHAEDEEDYMDILVIGLRSEPAEKDKKLDTEHAPNSLDRKGAIEASWGCLNHEE